MPFWSKKKDTKKDSTTTPSRSSSYKSLKSIKSHKSIDVLPTHSRNQEIHIDRNGHDITPTETLSIDLEFDQKLNLNSHGSNKLAKPGNLKKRVSTIVENNDEYIDDTDTDSVSGSDSEDDEDSYEESDEESVEDETYEDHLHTIRKLPFQLLESHLKSTLQKWKLISKQQLSHIDSESNRTYSLLDEQNRIHQLSCHFNNYDSVISDDQVKLIENLKAKVIDIMVNDNYQTVNLGKTLLQRYGTVTRVIGRGAYGLIKIIQPENDKTINKEKKFLVNKNLYAVKELLKRKDESSDVFVDRVIAEFIISSTLNNKHILKTVDLMVTLPETSNHELKLGQVMECTPGGDLYTYITTNIDQHDKPITFMSIDEIDCFLKQISKGLYYMHQHGIAHCDLKLENILISYKYDESVGTYDKAKIILKIGDFGKANVLRTKWETNNQLTCSTSGPIGSEPYMAPEEHSHDPKVNYSLIQKDNWSLGIVMLVLFSLRKRYYSGSVTNYECEERLHSEEPCGYMWSCTNVKSHSKKFKDKAFDDYMKTHMIADYDCKTKDWLVKRKGSFKPIERLFVVDDDDEESTKEAQTHEVDDLSELRRWIIYKLLDPNHSTRLTINELLKSDWMSSVESCS